MRHHSSDASLRGFAIVTVLLLTVLLGALLTAMFTLTSTEIASSRVSADMTSGFYAAEAGLNVRGELIRREFQGYRRPSGTPPSGTDPCVGGDTGSGDMDCRTLTVNDRTVTTYVLEDPRNNDPDDSERVITVPPGELFAGLSAIQYRYSVFSEAVPPGEDRPEALLEMIFRVRLVPLFQFAAFYDKDLEILPGPNMTLDGRVHANGDIYMESNNTLTINGQITAAYRQNREDTEGEGSGGELTGGDVYRGRKDDTRCQGRVEVRVPGGSRRLECEAPTHAPADVDGFDGQIRTRIARLNVPPPEEFAPVGLYWNEADVRLALDLRNGLDDAQAVVLQRNLNSGQPQINTVLTDRLETCLAADSAPRGYLSRDGGDLRDPSDPDVFGDEVRAVEWSDSFRDNRENRNSTNDHNSYRTMLEVDVRGLLDCLHTNRSQFFSGWPAMQNGIDTNRNGGLVWYLTVLGTPDNPSDSASSGYGVRLRNAEVLAPTVAGAPEIRGLTVVSDQAVFTSGNYNGATDRQFPSDGGDDPLWRPASILGDTYHLLSGNRTGDVYTTDTDPPSGLSDRRAVATTVAAALLANTDTTGGEEGTGGQNGNYNGGLENYPRMHENWSSRDLRYAGSFVSLGVPQHSTGQWRYGKGLYEAPRRDFNYDTRFNDAANLPPLTPRFVYLVQERFIREFDR